MIVVDLNKRVGRYNQISSNIDYAFRGVSLDNGSGAGVFALSPSTPALETQFCFLHAVSCNLAAILKSLIWSDLESEPSVLGG